MDVAFVSTSVDAYLSFIALESLILLMNALEAYGLLPAVADGLFF